MNADPSVTPSGQSYASPRMASSQREMTLSLDAIWHRLVLLAIVGLSAVLNFAGLGREGYSNEYYAAAIKSMSMNWHNFFFNSFDPGGFVTIDKPPLGFWFQVASVKMFGFSGVSLLVPQALAGVLSVALLYHLVARTFGRVAGLIAAMTLAVTPISIVTNRNNTIDSTLVLVILLAAWAVLKAAETGRIRWLVLSAVFVGLGFNIKMLQAYLVLPAFGLVYLMGARRSISRRLLDLLFAGIVLVVVSFSWVIAVDLTPANQRPWVDSTTTNSELNLAIGYNGLQRLTGNTAISSRGRTTGPQASGSTAGSSHLTASQRATAAIRASLANGGPGGSGGANNGPGGVGENGPIGVLRLLDSQLGSQIGWLLPLAILGFLVALWQTRPRFLSLDDRQRSLILWGVWLLTTGVFFSIALFFHTYYLVMMAPAVSALAGIGIVALWTAYRRSDSKMWWLLPLAILGGGVVQAYILSSYPAYSRWLTPLVLGGCILAAIIVAAVRFRPAMTIRVAIAGTTVAVGALLAAPATWAAETAQNTQTGAILHAGPTAAGARGGFVGPGGFRPGGSFDPPPGAPQGGPPRGVSGGSGPGAFGGPGGPVGSRAGGLQGFGTASADSTLISYLTRHRGSTKFLVATTSSNEAAPIILATGDPVMSLGGFSGNDPILTTAKLAALVKQGVVRYFLLGGRGGGPNGGSGISSWVQSNCTSVSYTSSTGGAAQSSSALYRCGSRA